MLPTLLPIGVPANFNLWGEEKAQPLHLLRSNLIMDCRFRRSRHFRELEEKSPGSLVFVWRLCQDVLEFVRAGEEGLGVGAGRDDLAVVGTRKVHRGKDHLAGDAASFKALKDAGVVNDHPLWSGALVGHFADLHRFGTCTFFGGLHPRLKNAAFLGLLVLNSNHSCFVLAVIYVTISLALRMF